MLYAGLDIHKEFSQAVLCRKDGEILKEEKIKSEKEDLEKFFSGFENVKVVFEAIRALMSPLEKTRKRIGFEVKEPPAKYKKSKKPKKRKTS